MIAFAMHVSVKKTKLLTQGQAVLSEPFVKIAQWLGGTVLARVQHGEGPHGKWKSYAVGAKKYDWLKHGKDRRFFWVEPGRPHPYGDSYVFTPRSGAKKGWGVYRDVEGYYTLGHKEGQPHTFTESGRLMGMAQVRRVTVKHMRVAFYGTHRKGMAASKVAFLASRNEDYALLEPTAEELRTVQEMVAASLTEATIEGARMGERAQQIGNRSARIDAKFRRLSKMLGD